MGQYISTPERVGRRHGFKKGFDQGIYHGIQEGREGGREEGRAVGIVEGLHQGEAAVLIRLLQHRFGELPDYVFEKIKQADIETLLTWSEHILDVNSLEEVFN